METLEEVWFYVVGGFVIYFVLFLFFTISNFKTLSIDEILKRFKLEKEDLILVLDYHSIFDKILSHRIYVGFILFLLVGLFSLGYEGIFNIYELFFIVSFPIILYLERLLLLKDKKIIVTKKGILFNLYEFREFYNNLNYKLYSSDEILYYKMYPLKRKVKVVLKKYDPISIGIYNLTKSEMYSLKNAFDQVDVKRRD